MIITLNNDAQFSVWGRVVPYRGPSSAPWERQNRNQRQIQRYYHLRYAMLCYAQIRWDETDSVVCAVQVPLQMTNIFILDYLSLLILFIHPWRAIMCHDIVLGGENISSIEVEAHLLTHSMIDEAAVIAVPDEKWGEVPYAFITLRNNADTPIDGTYVRTFLSVCLHTCMHTCIDCLLM